MLERNNISKDFSSVQPTFSVVSGDILSCLTQVVLLQLSVTQCCQVTEAKNPVVIRCATHTSLSPRHTYTYTATHPIENSRSSKFIAVPGR